MKRNVLYNLLLLPFALLFATWGMSQTTLANDQNPNYLISEAKYTRMADSINEWHGTTPQETYKAIDWMQQRQEARDARRAFRRELRLERARYGYYGYYGNYGNYGYGYYNNYYPAYSNYNYYRPFHHYHNGWDYAAWGIPVAATLAWWLTR